MFHRYCGRNLSPPGAPDSLVSKSAASDPRSQPPLSDIQVDFSYRMQLYTEQPLIVKTPSVILS